MEQLEITLEIGIIAICLGSIITVLVFMFIWFWTSIIDSNGTVEQDEEIELEEYKK